jgi:hypothetical protein
MMIRDWKMREGSRRDMGLAVWFWGCVRAAIREVNRRLIVG